MYPASGIKAAKQVLVDAILADLRGGELTYFAIAVKFGISLGTVYNIAKAHKAQRKDMTGACAARN